MVDCPVLHDMTTAAECRYFTALYRNARSGAGGIDFPKEMTRGETRTISFAISAAAPGDGGSVTELLGTAPTQQFKLKVGRRMAALLQGDGFVIKPAGLQHRDLGIGDGARWDWQVTAQKALHHRLTLSAFIVAKAPGAGQAETLLQSKKLDITVRVTRMQKYQDFVDDAVSVSNSTKLLIAALAAVLTALIALRKQVAELVRGFLPGRNGADASSP
jgi:hypothetical protein